MNKACFFDRDGVIIEMVYDLESGSVYGPFKSNQVIIGNAITETLRETRKMGFLNILVSNQPNIGLKRMTMTNFNKIKNTVDQKLALKKAFFDKDYYCFHHPYSHLKKFKKDCNCRKPKIGLFLRASRELDIDLKKSWLIGDGVYDIVAGKKAGCKTILISSASLESGYYKKFKEKLNCVEPDYVIKNTDEILSIIKKNS